VLLLFSFFYYYKPIKIFIMKTFINLAKKAFKEGSNIYGEKITGYVNSKLSPCTYARNHYTITLRLVQPNGHKCSTDVGFDLYSLRKGENNEQFCKRHKCEVSPYRYYLFVVSGHIVFTVPVTTEMLDAFPMGLNKKSLDQYTWQELEKRVYTLKVRELQSLKRNAYSDIWQRAEELGLDSNMKLKVELEFEEIEELPF
jgi:hypothetical protein